MLVVPVVRVVVEHLDHETGGSPPLPPGCEGPGVPPEPDGPKGWG